MGKKFVFFMMNDISFFMGENQVQLSCFEIEQNSVVHKKTFNIINKYKILYIKHIVLGLRDGQTEFN